jgi:hypothetical protein
VKTIAPFLLVLLVPACPLGAEEELRGRTVNAWQLLGIVENAYEQAFHAAKAGGLERRQRLRPFWNAMDRAGRALEQVGTALRSRDRAFFPALEEGSTALGEVRVLWSRAGLRSPEVDARLRLLVRSYRLLRASYGAEHLRARQGGELTPGEAEGFTFLQFHHGELTERLDALRRSSAEHGDRTTAAEMARLEAESEWIALAPPTLDSYLKARIATDELAGELEANRAHASARDEPLWKSAQQTVEQLVTDPAVGHVFTLELGKVNDWSHLETETFLPDEPEVTTFTPADGDEEALAGLSSSGEGDDDPAGLFPPDPPADTEAPAEPAEPNAPVAAKPELPPMLSALLLWFSLRFG